MGFCYSILISSPSSEGSGDGIFLPELQSCQASTALCLAWVPHNAQKHFTLSWLNAAFEFPEVLVNKGDNKKKDWVLFRHSNYGRGPTLDCAMNLMFVSLTKFKCWRSKSQWGGVFGRALIWVRSWGWSQMMGFASLEGYEDSGVLSPSYEDIIRRQSSINQEENLPRNWDGPHLDPEL